MSAKVSTFSRGVTFVSSGETGTQANEFEAAIKSITSSTTVGAVFVYDTRNDSDPSWRKRCQGLSWYDEDLNTTTRGGRREFPSVALIVADNGGTSNVTIYDLDDPAMPMWMVINRGGGHILYAGDMGSVFALNGRLYVGHNGSVGALSEIKFADDFGFVRINATSEYNGATIADREGRNSDTVTGTTGALVNRTVNDVAATVLEGAEIGALGLPIPTVAVATDGGVSVIHPNGSVCDGHAAAKTKVEFTSNGSLLIGRNDSTSSYFSVVPKGNYFADGFTEVDFELSYAEQDNASAASYIPNFLGSNPQLAALAGDGIAVGCDVGLNIYKHNSGNKNESAVAYITSSYNTGFMLGDIRFAGLANGGTSDRSVKSNHLTTTGSVAGVAVATNAELVGFSGFSASNYLSRASDTDFDFGTGDFSISLWVKNTNWTGTQRLLGRSQDSNTKRLSIYASGTTLYAYIKDTTTKSASANVLQNNVWQHVFAFRRGSVLYLFVDGKLVNSVAGADSINITPASNGMLVIGSETFDNGSTIESTALVNGSLSLVRISATAPTPQQVKEIYEAERPLFRAGAKCLLAANQVNDLAYDSSTNLLHVASESTSSSKSFRGLEAVESLTSDGSFGLAASKPLDYVAASGGVVVGVGGDTSDADTSGCGVNLPAIDVRGDLNTADSKLPDDGKLHFSGVTTDATQTVIANIPMEELETMTVEAIVTGHSYQSASSNRVFTHIRETFNRNLGGNIQEPGDHYKLENLGTASCDVTLKANTSTNTVQIEVTGVSGQTPATLDRMQWNATVEVQRITERSYER